MHRSLPALQSLSDSLLKLKGDTIIQRLSQIASEEGAEAFLVGGSIRDLLLLKGSQKIREYDVVVGCDPAAFSRRIAEVLGGVFFPLDEERRIYRMMASPEVSIRAPFPKGHDFIEKRGVQVDLSLLKGTILDDLRKRDFTVNAMAIPVGAAREGRMEWIDPLGGMEDLKKGWLRAVSEEVFDEDPVRLLRAYRISALMGLKIEERTGELIEQKAYLLRNAPRERVRDEFFLILASRESAMWVAETERKGLLEMFPPFLSLPSLEMADHLLSELGVFGDLYPLIVSHLNGEIGGIPRYGYLKFAALIHDLRGEGTISRLSKEFKLSKRGKRLLMNILTATSRVMKGGGGERSRASFFREYGEDGVEASLFVLVTASSGKPLSKIKEYLHYYFNTFIRRPLPPLLTGRDIISLFHIPPGTEVGRMLKALKEAEMEGKVVTREEAIRFLQEIYRKGLTKNG